MLEKAREVKGDADREGDACERTYTYTRHDGQQGYEAPNSPTKEGRQSPQRRRRGQETKNKNARYPRRVRTRTRWSTGMYCVRSEQKETMAMSRVALGWGEGGREATDREAATRKKSPTPTEINRKINTMGRWLRFPSETQFLGIAHTATLRLRVRLSRRAGREAGVFAKRLYPRRTDRTAKSLSRGGGGGPVLRCCACKRFSISSSCALADGSHRLPTPRQCNGA